MRSTVSRSIAAALAGALVLTSLPAGATQPTASKPTLTQASPSQDAIVTDFSARRRHARSHNNGAAALAAFGLIAGTIATIAANERRQDYYERRGYGYYGYAPRPRPPGYYYGPRYRYW
jgi:nicotinic acid phosphoribosyltransferase